MTDELLEQLQLQRRELRGCVLRLNRLVGLVLDQIAVTDALIDQAQALAALDAAVPRHRTSQDEREADPADEGARRHAARS